MARTALIIGVDGQDGSHLAELLLSKGYEVHGLARSSSTSAWGRIGHLDPKPRDPEGRLFLHESDLVNSSPLLTTIFSLKPNEVYNLCEGSQFAATSEAPGHTPGSLAVGTLGLLEAIRFANWPVRFYQAGSSDMFGRVFETPQTEKTPFNPRGADAVANVFAHYMTVEYREAYGLHASNGILFNHESPRRGGTFVSRKVTQAIAGILQGTIETIYLGNLDAGRDWGYAPEFVDAMWRMLQQDQGDDYVIATGETHTVRELVECAFGFVGLDWRNHVESDPAHIQPTEPDVLAGNPSKARDHLGWEPSVKFTNLVGILLHSALTDAGLDPDHYIRG